MNKLIKKIEKNIDLPMLIVGLGIFIPDLFLITIELIAKFTIVVNYKILAFIAILPISVIFSILIVKMIKVFFISFTNRIKNGEELVTIGIAIFFIGYNVQDFFFISKEVLFLSMVVVSFGLILYSLYRKANLNIADIIITITISLLTIMSLNTGVYIFTLLVLIKGYLLYLLLSSKNDSDVVNTSIGFTSFLIFIIKKIILK